MKNAAVTFIITLLIMAQATMFLAAGIGLAGANPFDLPVDDGIRIYSTNYIPYQEKQHENSTATLKINVKLVYGQYDKSWSVHLDSVCYSLDGQPLVYVTDFAVENYVNFTRDKQSFFTYTATVKLENLCEGRHTVTAYANDTHNAYAYINNLSASYNFTVTSNYQVTVATPTPSPEATPQPPLSIDPDFSFYTGLALMIIFVAVFAGLLFYFKKRKH